MSVTENLTPKQIKKQESNKRYQLRLKERLKNNVSTLSTSKEIVSKKIKNINVSKLPFIILSVSITALLIFFQTKTYYDDGMDLWLSLSISIVCEVSLCYLAITRNLISTTLFVCLFCYTLGTMSYGIRIEAEKITAEAISQDQKNKMILSTIERAKAAVDLALEKKDLNIVTRHMKTLEAFSKEDIKLGIDQNLIHFQSYWFIALRAILMLINATLIHKIARREL